MADTTNIASCTYGAGTFVVIDYTVRETPNIDKALGARIGTFVRVEIDGEVRSAGVDDFSTQLQETENAFRVDGQDLTIYGLNGTVEYTLPASGSIDGGPHCGFELHRGDSMLSKKIKCIVTTQQGPSGSNTPANSYAVKTAETADGLQVVTWTGQLTGVATMSYFLSAVWPAFQSAYGQGSIGQAGPGPIEGTGYWSLKGVVDLSQPTTNTTQTLKYTLTATEYFGPLPDDGGGNTAVEGSASQTVSRDEHYRLTTTNEFDLLLAANSDPIKILTYLRPTNGVILHESYKLSTLRENRVSGSFTQLASADPMNAPLMNFQQTARLQIPPTLYEEKRYVGAQPILVQAPTRMPRVIQSGSAMAAGAFYKGPTPIYSIQTSMQEYTLTDHNDLEKETAWNFEMVATTFTPGDGNGGSGGSTLADLTQFDASQIGRNQVDVKAGGSGSGWFKGVTPPQNGTSEDGGS